jgi:DNA polymerase I-like protein with 3'-5' exonuclease and polymerase domains
MQRPDPKVFKRLSLDIETYDPNLRNLGPGVYRGDGKILGVSLCDGEGFNEYYNLGHYDCTPDERVANESYLREVLATPVIKIGQNIIYDLDWLENSEYEFQVNGKLRSIEIAEALLDEEQGQYNLDFMGKKYLGEGKKKSQPERFCEENRLDGDFRAWLWKMPYSMVREYAKDDADKPLRIHDIQQPMIVEQEMSDLYDLECELTRCLLLFRKTGVFIDEDKRDRNGLKIQSRIEELESELFAKYGEFNCNSTAQIAPIFDRAGIRYPYNVLFHGAKEAEGNVWRTERDLQSDPSVKRFSPNIDAYFYKRFGEKERSEAIPLVVTMNELRQNRSHLDKFVMGSHVRFVGPDGKIHCSFYNMRNDSFGNLKGTRSGRFSSANPNLQQQPSKGVDEYWGKICREDFVPYPDHWWMKFDYSQIEYRFLAHFAVGPGSEELRAAYNRGDVDYHQYIMDLTGLKRRYAKNLNFGVAFGMGALHMAELFGWTEEYAREILAIYHERAPYVKATTQAVEQVAKKRGYIKTFLKRRSHLIDSHKAYKMFCRLLQGSAADLMKKAMHDIYKAGLYDVLKPHATVHDEIDVSVPKTKEGIEAAREHNNLMETCLTLKVPIKAEAEVGPNWADIVEFEWAQLVKEIT